MLRDLEDEVTERRQQEALRIDPTPEEDALPEALSAIDAGNKEEDVDVFSQVSDENETSEEEGEERRDDSPMEESTTDIDESSPLESQDTESSHQDSIQAESIEQTDETGVLNPAWDDLESTILIGSGDFVVGDTDEESDDVVERVAGTSHHADTVEEPVTESTSTSYQTRNVVAQKIKKRWSTNKKKKRRPKTPELAGKAKPVSAIDVATIDVASAGKGRLRSHADAGRVQSPIGGLHQGIL